MKLNIILIILIFSSGIILAADFTPQGDINLRGVYKIYNVTNISFLGGNIITNDDIVWDNQTWNETRANNLYSGIEWAYNQTTPANTYTDSVNASQSSWINSVFLKIADMFTQSEIVNMIFGNWSDLETRKLNLTDQRYNETQIILDNNDSWSSTYNLTYFGAINNASYLSTYNATYESSTGDNSSWNQTYANTLYSDIIWGYNQTYSGSTYNATYDAIVGDNQTWNQTLANTLYAEIGAVGNASWNQTYANDLYADISVVDTNESDRFNNLTNVNCQGTEKAIGVYANGTIECSAVAGGGDFSFSDFKGSFDTNWSDLDYDKWMYNQTYSGSTYNESYSGSLNNASYLSTYNSTYDSATGDNATWNESRANTLYRLDSWNNLTGIPTATPSNGDTTHFSLADQIYDWVISLNYVANAITSLAQDTSPQLGGYLDTAGENIGATDDEIENVYVADNSRIYFGNGQDAFIYWNTTDLVIEVS